MNVFLTIFQTAGELGLITSIAVLALYLSYLHLNVCDLSTDGCFTLGASVGCVVALSGHPYLAILAAIGSGMVSGFVVAFLQTKMGVNSLLAGIIVNTALYSINIAIMGNSSVLSLNKVDTIFSDVKALLSGTWFESGYKLIVAIVFVVVIIVFLTLFLRTRLGLAIRATGDNIEMVKSSSISPAIITIIGLTLSNGLTALSGALLAFSQKSTNIDIGTGIVTIALASLLIGNIFFKKRGLTLKAIGCVIGALLFRTVYTIALRFNMPASYLKLISAILVLIPISAPYLKEKGGVFFRKLKGRKESQQCLK